MSALSDALDELRITKAQLSRERQRAELEKRRADLAEASASRAWQLASWHTSSPRQGNALMPGSVADRAIGALPCVTEAICPGCGARFEPAHWRQKHCRPSCRVAALRQRREPTVDLFTSIADHVEAAVVK